MSLQLGPEEVRHYLHEVELPERRNGTLGSFADEIIRYGAFVGSAVEYHHRLERAMEHGRSHIDMCENAGRSVNSGRIILAESLSGSKGRFARTWHAPAGGLWGCLIHANSLTPKSAMLLSFSVGIAACESVSHFVPGDKTRLRWVNDVLVEGVKVAGFLIEGYSGPRWKEQFHLIGFGINVNNRVFPDELKDIAVSIGQAVGKDIDLQEFSLSFIAKLVWNIGLLYFVEARQSHWIEDGDGFVHPVVERWMELSDTLGKQVMFGYDVMNKPQYSGRVTGIAGDGGLEIELDDGLKVTEHSGEVRYL